MTGIHNNTECVRCGACCTYFIIHNSNEELISAPNESCPHLTYNGGKARCKIYDSKPPMCESFTCDRSAAIFRGEWGESQWQNLKKTAERIRR